MRGRTIVLTAGLLVIAAPAATSAAPLLIEVTTGYAEESIERPDRIDIAGTDGFSLQATLDRGSSCLPSCGPYAAGDTIPTSIFWVGLDVYNGQLTLDGTTYTDFGALSSRGSVLVEFISDRVVAPLVTPGLHTLVFPFEFAGRFSETGGNALVEFTGQGTASLEIFGLVTGGTSLWSTHGIRWDFAPASVPEPGTTALFALGAVTAWRVARRRRTATLGVTDRSV